MKDGILTTRLSEFIGTASSYEIMRIDDIPGVLTIEAQIADETWRIRLDLDSDSKGSLQIFDREGKSTKQNLVMIPAYFDRKRKFVRPRESNDSSVPETISFDLEGSDICVEGIPPMSGKRSVTIDLYNDQPIENKMA